MGFTLTPPERAAARDEAKRIRESMSNICDYCIHRQTYWGYNHCPHEGRTYPACVTTPGISFEFDESVRGQSCTSAK